MSDLHTINTELSEEETARITKEFIWNNLDIPSKSAIIHAATTNVLKENNLELKNLTIGFVYK